MTLGLLWDDFGADYGSRGHDMHDMHDVRDMHDMHGMHDFGVPFGITLGSLWGHFGVTLKFFTLRAPAEARPEVRIRKSSFFPCFSLNFWLKTRFLKSRDPGGHSYQAGAHETYSRPIS